MEAESFSPDYLEQAAELVHEAHRKEFEFHGGGAVSTEFCREQIITELSRDEAHAYMLVDNNNLLGFAVGIIEKDVMWGDTGRVNLGGWGIIEGRKELLNFLYRKIGEDFLEMGIKQHYFEVWNNDRDVLDIMNNLGFAKEQTYAVLGLSSRPEDKTLTRKYNIRKGKKSDREQLSKFSRLIAEHQLKSPCFAAAPDAYLKALDEGFKGLLDDSEADVIVIEADKRLIGYQVYFEGEVSLTVPPGSMELTVSGISEDCRGRGAGYALTSFGLNRQHGLGYKHAVTDWRCANLLSGRFWESIGFAPTSHRLIRRIDPLI